MGDLNQWLVPGRGDLTGYAVGTIGYGTEKSFQGGVVAGSDESFSDTFETILYQDNDTVISCFDPSSKFNASNNHLFQPGADCTLYFKMSLAIENTTGSPIDVLLAVKGTRNGDIETETAGYQECAASTTTVLTWEDSFSCEELSSVWYVEPFIYALSAGCNYKKANKDSYWRGYWVLS